jgi:3',5'-cyclic AMP phosphodiesterase CpdA
MNHAWMVHYWPMSGRIALLLPVVVAALACSHAGGSPAPPVTPPAKEPPTVLPPLADVPTTRDRTLVPITARVSANDAEDPALPAFLPGYEGRAFGDLGPGPGDGYVVRVIDGSVPPAPGPNAKRLVRFAHLTDLQIGDDESPTRLATFDSTGITSSALRPQDAYLCAMTNSAVRTINALHAKDPIAFTLMGGDNADSAQTNEVDWALGILSGSGQAAVECDSGADDDPVPGPGNDGKDPFVAEGLHMPWKWVTGNHDVLVQGNLPVTDITRQVVLGTSANGGTRRYDQTEGGAVDRGAFVVADARRALLSGPELMKKVAADGDGHGIGPASMASGHATYTFDVEGTPLRVLVIDTAHAGGAADGVITQRDVAGTLKPLFDQAKADGKWLILASHHATSSLTDGSGLGGTSEPDALTTAQWVAFVGQYPNVVFSMVGHTHRHRVLPIQPPAGHAWWEVMTSAIADYPHEFRIVEIFDQDNGWLMLRGTCVDFAFDADAVATEGKKRGVVDFTSGWLPDPSATPADENVELWIKKPS